MPLFPAISLRSIGRSLLAEIAGKRGMTNGAIRQFQFREYRDLAGWVKARDGHSGGLGAGDNNS
jgi:hypothetical protein